MPLFTVFYCTSPCWCLHSHALVLTLLCRVCFRSHRVTQACLIWAFPQFPPTLPALVVFLSLSSMKSFHNLKKQVPSTRSRQLWFMHHSTCWDVLYFSLNKSLSPAAEWAIIDERFSHRGTSALKKVLNMILHLVKDMFLSLGFSWDICENHRFSMGSLETVWISSLNQSPEATDSLWLVVLLNYWVNECQAVYEVNDVENFFFLFFLGGRGADELCSAEKGLSVNFVMSSHETGGILNVLRAVCRLNGSCCFL